MEDMHEEFTDISGATDKKYLAKQQHIGCLLPISYFSAVKL